MFLFQLFDRDNHVNKHASNYLFNTEGHIFPISQMFRDKPWEEDLGQSDVNTESIPTTVIDVRDNVTATNVSFV